MQCEQESKNNQHQSGHKQNTNVTDTMNTMEPERTPAHEKSEQFVAHPPKTIKQKNRRYSKLKQLWKDGYFQQQQIILKYPMLYHDYVGKYKKYCTPIKFHSMSEFLQAQLINSQYRQLVKEQLEKRQREGSTRQNQMVGQENDKNPYTQDLLQIKQQDLQIQEQSLIDYIEEQFLLGSLPGFDYEQIDTNEKLDDVKIMTEDEEEKYFDENDNNSIENAENDPTHNTGVQDF